MSASVLVLAALLSIRQEREVLVPFLGVPLPELCLLKRTTGLACPGCGLTRCFISLAHGDLRAAWSYNLGGLVFFPIVVVQIPLRLVQIWRIRRGLPEIQLGRLVPVAFGVLGALLLGQWLLRMCGMTF
jgi:hypothetical protein